MKEGQVQEARKRRHWRTAPELPEEVFAAWRKLNKAFSPTAIVATIDPDGAPRTAPFGSLRAVTPRLLRMLSWRGHDTCANLRRDGRVMVALLAPPNLAVSVRGQARVVREQMNSDKDYVAIEIDIEEVKNDMVRIVVIDSGVAVTAVEQFQGWFDAVLGELEDLD